MPYLKLLGPHRRFVQWSLTLSILLIPFGSIDGAALLRLDMASLSLHLLGNVLGLEDLYLFLLFSLCLILFLLLATLVLGRAWCGWLCPQTTWCELSEWFSERISTGVLTGSRTGRLLRQALQGLFNLTTATLVGANILWYFIAPRDFFHQIATLSLGALPTQIWMALSFIVFLDLCFLGRLMCKELCPYGRLQSTLVDVGTLVLRFHPDEAPRCIRCEACARCCPMGIDIRQGEQIECIGCGKCLDACRKVMAGLGQAGIIRYTFGTRGLGFRALLNPRIGIATLALVLAAMGLFTAVMNRPQATLKITRAPMASGKTLGDGSSAQFFTGILANRSAHENLFRLQARTPEGSPIDILGPTQDIRLSSGEKRRIDFALRIRQGLLPPKGSVIVEVLGDGRAILAQARIFTDAKEFE